MRGLRVKVIDMSGSFVSFKYMSSNAKTRVKKTAFMKDYEKGVYDVVNPEIMGDVVEVDE